MRFVPSRIERRPPRGPAEPAQETVATLVALTYELLDAHADTARIAGQEASAEEWQLHLAYLRDLQRIGREAVARAVAIGGDRSPLAPPRRRP